MKKINLKVFSAFFVLFATMQSYAQTSIVESSKVTYQQLNERQKQRYDAYLKNKTLTDFKIITVKPISEVIVNSRIYVSLGEYLPCSLLIFLTGHNEFKSDNEYSWAGGIQNDDTSDCDYGFFSLSNDSGAIIGHISINNSSYEIFDLTGGQQVILKTDLDQGTKKCPIGDAPRFYVAPPPPSHPTDCIKNKTRILEFFTAAAKVNNPNIEDIAREGVNQLNAINGNSEIDEIAEFIGAQQLFFTETNSMANDWQSFRTNIIVDQIRKANKADICVLLVDNLDLSAFGTVGLDNNTNGINATFSSAFAVVQAKAATSSRFTFAHEVSHLFGARHERDADDTPTKAHAYKFKTRKGGSEMRYTLLHRIGSGESRIQYISNPDVEFKNKQTGNVNCNNSAEVESFKEHIRGIFRDAIVMDGALTINNPSTCSLNGIAYAQGYCGKAPFTYTWDVSEDGITWVSKIGNGNTLKFDHYYPPIGAIATYLMIRVTIKDTNGLTVQKVKASRANCSKTKGTFQTMKLLKRSFSNNRELNINITIYPNPSNDQFTISNDLPSGAYEVQIFDIVGNLIESETIFSNNKKCSLSGYGTSIIRITNKLTKIPVYTQLLFNH